MSEPLTILSMLHEPPAGNSADRLFRDEPVLAWTLRRLNRAATILCWDDQAAAAAGAIGKSAATLSVRGPRQTLREMDAVTASRRWADGWRGGLLGTCECDRGFHAPWVEALRQSSGAGDVLLVDPAAGLVDPVLIDGLLAQSQTRPDVDFWFSQAAPGLSGVLIRPSLLEKLAAAKGRPGILLTYRPDLPRRDPIADPACVPIPVQLARTTRRFTLDSQWQIERWSAATAHLNGELISTDGLGLLAAIEKTTKADATPRELVVELTTHRATEPIYWPGKRLDIARKPMRMETLRPLLAVLARRDDARLLLAGVGDPLLHEQVLEVIAASREAGVSAIAMETDFVGVPSERVAMLAESAVDVVSVHVPAVTNANYREVMGVDALAEAMTNFKVFLQKRQARGRDVPLLVPTFMKCRKNQAEMEVWYDHWLRTIGGAVVAGPSDFAGLIPDAAAVDMSGLRRRPCGSLWSRLMVLSDGRIVSCEQDVLGRQSLGVTIAEAWAKAGDMRKDHLADQWARHPACAKCKQWNRA
jgi:hypothetical protein